ncbi:MAG TPA: hypothetical protein ENI42_05195 [Thermoplasmatales archaeon]|nr:hypothetical protein [Thermoplasmatales archaeon]
MEEDSVLVTPVKEIGVIPSWVGEDIPVPFEVAQEVGWLRKVLMKGKKEVEGYPCNKQDFKRVVEELGNVEGFVVPSDDVVTVESKGNVLVINACFGTKVNETLGRLVSSLLAQKHGESVRMGSDPYRIVLEFSGRVRVEDVKSLLFSIEPEAVEYLLRVILKNSSFIKWYLVHIGKKFGALSKDFDATSVGVKRLFELFEDSVVLEETLNKILWDRMDVENTMDVLRRIKKGEIRVVKQGFSVFSNIGFEVSRGLAVPQRAESVILEMLEKRLDEHRILLLCLNCFHSWRSTVKRAGVHPTCSRCGALRVAVVRDEEVSVVKKRNLGEDERMVVKRLGTNASLVLSYGRFALLALAARGVGPVTAARILRRYRFQELVSSEEVRKRFLKDIWRAELQYAETRGFWDRD